MKLTNTTSKTTKSKTAIRFAVINAFVPVQGGGNMWNVVLPLPLGADESDQEELACLVLQLAGVPPTAGIQVFSLEVFDRLAEARARHQTNKVSNATVVAQAKAETKSTHEAPGGLYFVIQTLLSEGEPYNAMVFLPDAQLDDLEHAMTPQMDKREVVAGLILRDLGFPPEMVIGAQFTLEVFESEAEARAAIAHNRASKADFVRAVNAARN